MHLAADRHQHNYMHAHGRLLLLHLLHCRPLAMHSTPPNAYCTCTTCAPQSRCICSTVLAVHQVSVLCIAGGGGRSLSHLCWQVQCKHNRACCARLCPRIHAALVAAPQVLQRFVHCSMGRLCMLLHAPPCMLHTHPNALVVPCPAAQLVCTGRSFNQWACDLSMYVQPPSIYTWRSGRLWVCLVNAGSSEPDHAHACMHVHGPGAHGHMRTNSVCPVKHPFACLHACARGAEARAVILSEACFFKSDAHAKGEGSLSVDGLAVSACRACTQGKAGRLGPLSGQAVWNSTLAWFGCLLFWGSKLE